MELGTEGTQTPLSPLPRAAEGRLIVSSAHSAGKERVFDRPGRFAPPPPGALHLPSPRSDSPLFRARAALAAARARRGVQGINANNAAFVMNRVPTLADLAARTRDELTQLIGAARPSCARQRPGRALDCVAGTSWGLDVGVTPRGHHFIIS